MAEDRDTATEQPTEKHLRESLEKGQFAQAQEIQVVIGWFACCFALLGMAPGMSERMMDFSVAVFGHLGEFDATQESISAALQTGPFFLLGLLVPILGVSLLAGLVAGGLQSGFRLTPKVLGIKFEKLDVTKGFQRLFSKQSLVRLVIDLGKIVLIGVLIYHAAKVIIGDPLFFTPVPPTRLGEFIFRSTISLLFQLSLLLAGLAVLHYLYQRQKVGKDLMMTPHEVKEENKQTQGDPLVKAALRAMARRLMMRQMLNAVPTADVIVTNPTHYAVALKYERGVDMAPVVLAKGVNGFANRIKAIGQKYEVPTVENKPVARALFKYGQVGKAIPPQLYQAIAEILGFVYKTHRYYFHLLKVRRVAAQSEDARRV